MIKTIFKYIGYFSAVMGAVGIVYVAAVFFTDLQNDIDTVIKTTDKIQMDQTSIQNDIREIKLEGKAHTVLINSLDKSLINHYKSDKKNTEELINYFELKDEAKKK